MAQACDVLSFFRGYTPGIRTNPEPLQSKAASYLGSIGAELVGAEVFC